MKIFVPGAGARMIPPLKSVPGVNRVIVSTNDPWGAGGFLADRIYPLPRFDEPGCAEGVLAIYERERFDACLPVLDSALLFFARHQNRFRDVPFRLGMSGPDVIEMACDKMRMIRSLASCGLPVPATSTFAEFLAGPRCGLPCFLKPRFPEDRDFGRAVYTRLSDESDVGYWATKLAGNLDRHIVQPVLEGQEFNINFFCDASGAVQSIATIRIVDNTPGGAIARGEIVEDDRFFKYVRSLAGAFHLWGANQLQAFVSPRGDICFVEINVRLNGSSPFVSAAGADEFANTVCLLRGEPVSFPERLRPLRMTRWDHLHFFEEIPIGPIHAGA